MPVYEYEHEAVPCGLGRTFEVSQAMRDPALTSCPRCAGPVRRILSRVNVSKSHSNAELRDMGFTKLVRRDDGVYENVTRRGDDSRYMEQGRPETMPNLSGVVSD